MEKILLEKGAALDSIDKGGQTPLSWAARRGCMAVVKLPVEMDAPVGSVDNRYSRTPLLWAAENGHESVVKLLRSRAL